MPVPHTSPLLRRALGAVLALLLVATAACTGDRPELADEPDTTTSTTEAPETTTTTTEAAPVAADVAQAKEPRIDVFATADAAEPDREIVSGVDTSVDSIPIVFLVKDEGDERVEVYLPVRPNGSTGWVDVDDVTITSVRHRIEVGLTEKRIRVYDGEEVVVDEPVGVGRSDRPTPGGVYYLKELLQPPDPNGPYGLYAYGLSGFSNVLESFNGGPGVIGIHGTNDPSSIGSDVSSGCIRLNNDVIDRMVNEIGLPLGTPVEIQA
jgi:lipoprotein-anchoring transpeptidase ErfK/SrfK